MDSIAQYLAVDHGIMKVLAGIIAALVVGTVLRLSLLVGKDTETRHKKVGSLLAWWVLVMVFTIASILGTTAGIILIGVISFMGLREFLEITDPRFHEKPLRTIAFLVLPVHYLFILLRWNEAFWTFIPAIIFLLLPVSLILAGHTERYIEKASMTTWGLFLTVYGFSHSALLLSLPEEINPSGGPIGLFLFLIILTEVNDIAQALGGRKFGRTKVVPLVSPNKSWEGLLLGILTTVILSIVLAPLITPLAGDIHSPFELRLGTTLIMPAAAGFLIAIGGFFGDLNMSAVKRDLGIKDAGHLIPGQGGILDRIDSLTYTAPLFFYFVYFLYL